MTTIKSFTDLEQSRNLAKILPLESADMHYVLIDSEKDLYSASLGKYIGILPHHPAWSLAALLSVLPDEVGDNHYLTLDKEGKEYCCCYEDGNGNSFRHCFSDNPIDACVAMVIKLSELNLL